MTADKGIIQLSPVTGWSIQSIQALDAIFLEFSYLSSPMQKLKEAHLSQKFLFQKQQLVELRSAIDRILQKHETGDFQGIPPDFVQ